MNDIQLEPRHKKIIQEILKNFNIEAYAFGSRAKGTARPLSDMDLCLKSKIEKRVLTKLKNTFEESNLPFKVDIVVWSDISENFQRQIEKDLVLFPSL